MIRAVRTADRCRQMCPQAFRILHVYEHNLMCNCRCGRPDTDALWLLMVVDRDQTCANAGDGVKI